MNSLSHPLDKFDCAILAALQSDGTLSIAALSERIGLSSTPCWKRVKRLEEEGYIESRVAIIHRGALAATGSLDEIRRQLSSDGSLEDIFLQLTDATAAA